MGTENQLEPMRLGGKEIKAFPDDELTLLNRLRTRYIGEDISSLLHQLTPREVIKNRPGRGGSYDYVPIYWVVEIANALFGYLWSIEIEDSGMLEEELEIEDPPEGLSHADYQRLKVQNKIPVKKVKMPTQVWVRGHVDIHIPGNTVIERFPDGRVIETRLEPITIRKSSFGGTDIKYFQDGSGIVDIGDDYKSAEADLIKKAFSYLGLLSDMYGRREIQSETGPSEAQLKIVMKKAAYLGDNVQEKLDKMCEAEFKVNLAGLDSGQYAKLLRLLAQGSKGHASPAGVLR